MIKKYKVTWYDSDSDATLHVFPELYETEHQAVLAIQDFYTHGQFKIDVVIVKPEPIEEPEV